MRGLCRSLMLPDKNLGQRAIGLQQNGPTGTGAKVSLELTPIDNVTLSDRYYPGERAVPPTGRVGQSLATAFCRAVPRIPECAYARTQAANAGQPHGVAKDAESPPDPMPLNLS